jgi:hypothetical protein
MFSGLPVVSLASMDGSGNPFRRKSALDEYMGKQGVDAGSLSVYE